MKRNVRRTRIVATKTALYTQKATLRCPARAARNPNRARDIETPLTRKTPQRNFSKHVPLKHHDRRGARHKSETKYRLAISRTSRCDGRGTNFAFARDAFPKYSASSNAERNCTLQKAQQLRSLALRSGEPRRRAIFVERAQPSISIMLATDVRFQTNVTRNIAVAQQHR